MGNIVDRNCERCGTAFQAKSVKGQYQRRYCTHSCAMNRFTSTEARFWANVDKRGPDDCWLWTRCHNGVGYGMIAPNGKKQVYAHRFSYELHVGPIPKDAYLLHSCDNPPCVNPAHLRIGNDRENMRDVLRRGRRGPGIKLNPERVKEIRQMVAGKNDWPMMEALATKFRCKPESIWLVVTGRTWRWVE